MIESLQRVMSKDAFQKMKLRSTGMEFATEMIIKSSLIGARVAEVPITLHPDGRKQHGPHLPFLSGLVRSAGQEKSGRYNKLCPRK